MRARPLASLLLLALLSALPTVAGAEAEPIEKLPRVVVAVADTGVNPYHEVYHRPELTEHPCEWVEGFDDCSIPALELSIGEYDTYAEAYAADRDVWESLELHQWYWIPRTNIIGAVCEGSGSLTSAATTCILDDNGHGTGTTSSVLSEAPDALLLVHQGNSGAYDLATAPVMPDLQSHSWSAAAPVAVGAADAVVPGDLLCGDPAFEPGTIFFNAAGNEAPFPAAADCLKLHPRVQIVGGGWPGHTHHGTWTTVDFTSWHCRPMADTHTITGTRESCGTSFAAPTATGAAAAALLEIRRAEGHIAGSTADMVSATVSREVFLDALRASATYSPGQRFDTPPRVWAVPLPEQAPYVFWGYGWLDSLSTDTIVTCALDGDCPTKSAEAMAYQGLVRDLRRAQGEDVLPRPQQDDAGSGRDAGETRRTAVAIEAGVDYAAQLYTVVNGPDDTDWYLLDLQAGDALSVSHDAFPACVTIHDPDGQIASELCGTPVEHVATVPGQYVIDIGYFAPPQEYTFRADVTPAPG